MTPSIAGWPTKPKEAPSPHEVRLALLDINPVFQSLGGKFLGGVCVWGGLYNFCNLVIIFSLMYIMMICGSSDILYRFGNDRILPKNM